MNQIELPELKKLIFKNVDCKNKVEHLILENHTVDFTWVESNRSYDIIQVQSINILITSNKNFGGVSKSMLALNESIIDIKEH